MNDRIRELVEVAFNDADYPTDQQYRIVPNAAFCEKFAELLIRECADVAAKVGEGYVQMGYVVPHECSDKIKQHFGVNE